MQNNLPLLGKTVVITGTQKATSILDDIEYFGGNALYYPLIETKEIIDGNDGMELELARGYDWLIFTSQNAVEAFSAKMKRMKLESRHFLGKIAAVGAKTAEALQNAGFQIDFVPSTFSADVFVKEFPAVAGDEPMCLFVRGNLAKSTLSKGLSFPIQQWTIYETVEKTESVQHIIEVIRSEEDVTIIFASPSAVDVFAKKIAPVVGWEKIKFAVIGHITASALKSYGATVHIQPEIYTMQAVLAQLVKMEESTHDEFTIPKTS